jgi:predicted TPR repeat methyltransferase
MNQELLHKASALHTAGRLDEAAAIYSQLIGADPNYFEARCLLGFVYILQGRYAEAEAQLAATVDLNPRLQEAWVQLSVAVYKQGRTNEALVCLDRALGLNPGDHEALTNRAVYLLELGRYPQALASTDTALAIKPDFVTALVNRGNALSGLKRFDEAIACYEAALREDPDNLSARENMQQTLFLLGRTSRCPPGYMRRLFDQFSAKYDSYMLDTLQYRAHLHLRDLANKLFPDAKAPMAILDLGSGTGLSGDAFKDWAAGGRLDGIDLSPAMNETAKKRGIYSELILGDLEPILASPGPSYDLMLAADTMIYIGDLAPTFGGAAQRLEPGGHFLLAVEAKEGAGWEQTPDNRFVHSLAYIREEAGRQGLEFVDSLDCVLRMQSGVPVKGFAVALRRPA